MRPILSLAALCALVVAAGCSKKRDPNATEIGSGPKLWLLFPEPPRIDKQDLGATKISNAMWTQKRTEGVLILSAMVMEITADGEKLSPEQMLEASAGAFKQYETSRTSFTIGKKKHPGLDITSKVTLTTGKPMFERKKIVVVGQNSYIASAGGTSEEYLTEKAVKKFFDSFEIEE